MEQPDTARTTQSTERTQAMPAQTYSAGPLDATQAIVTPTASGTSHIDADALLSDAEKRRKLEAELARMGMTPAEVQRLLAADSHSTEPASKPALPLASPAPAMPLPALPLPASRKSARVTADSLQSYAAQLMANKAEAQNQAVQTASVALALPEFRESSVQEKLHAESLLREANALRRRERFKEAETKCLEAISYVPRDAVALEFLGDILQDVGRIDEALAAYKRAMEADSKRASVEKKYGDLLMRQQNWGTADPEAVETNSFAAVLLSALLPGAGQFHNGDVAKGLFFLLADVICAYLLGWSPYGFASEHGIKGINMSLMTCFIIAGVVYIASVWDANLTARRNSHPNRH